MLLISPKQYFILVYLNNLYPPFLSQSLTRKPKANMKKYTDKNIKKII